MYYKHKPRFEYNRVYQLKWRELNPEKAILIQAKSRAKERGLEFSLTLEDIKIPEVCPILGIPLQQGGGRFWNSPSLDRIDSSKGYLKENVHVISGRANILKRDGTLEELTKLVNYLKILQCE